MTTTSPAGEPLVEDRGRLPDLAAQLRRRRRRRDRRPRGDRGAARLPRGARRRRAVAVADLPLAAGRRGLRHLRLPGHRPDVRHAGAVRRAAGGGARARDEARDGPRRQPHLRRAPVVRRVALEPGQPQARLVLVAPAARRDAGRRPGRRADELALVLLRAGVGARPGERRVLPAPVLAQAAGPQLGEPGGPPGDLRDDALVAGPRGRRLPHGRHQHDLQGPLAARRPRPARRARRRRAVLPQRPAHPRVPAGDAPRGLRRARRPAPQRRRDARRDRRRGAAVHRSRARRGRHGLPVRARATRPRRDASGTSARSSCATSRRP